MISSFRTGDFQNTGQVISKTPDRRFQRTGISKLSQKYDPEHTWITTVDLLSDLDMPHYDNLAYQEYMRIYYDGGDPMAFKGYMDSMVKLAKGQDDGRY